MKTCGKCVNFMLLGEQGYCGAEAPQCILSKQGLSEEEEDLVRKINSYDSAESCRCYKTHIDYKPYTDRE